MAQVAVIIPVYNGLPHIDATIRAVLAQSLKDWRLYLIDDGSSDGSAEAMERFCADLRVVVMRQANAGQAAAINHGLRLGREPLIALCDADDLWSPDRLERAVMCFNDHPEAGMLCHDFCRAEDPTEPWVSAWDTCGYKPQSHCALDRLLEQNFVARPATLLRRAVLEHVGPFSEAIGGKCGSDDRDMWLRIARRFPIHCLHEVLTFIREWTGRDSRSLRALESRVRLWMAWRASLRHDSPRRRRQVRKNLALAQFDLAYRRYRVDQRSARAAREFLHAACLGHSAPLHCCALALASLLGAASADFES